jgi:hypothetical protein
MPAVSEEARTRSQISSRRAKRRRRGVCERCRGETRYNGKTSAVSRLCVVCSNRERGLRKRGKGPNMDLIVGALERGPLRFSDLRDTVGLSNEIVFNCLLRLRKWGIVERPARGLYALKKEE